MNLEKQISDFGQIVKCLSAVAAKDLFGSRFGDFRSGRGQYFSDCRGSGQQTGIGSPSAVNRFYRFCATIGLIIGC